MKLSKILFILLTALILISCGGKDKNNGKTEISYMIWDKYQEPGMRKIADRFEELNPDIKVTISMYPWNQYWTKLDALAEGNQLPDLFWMHIGHFNRYLEANMLMDITNHIDNDNEINLNNYEKTVLDVYKDNQNIYGLPKDIDTVGIWYNKKLFDEANIPYPTSSMSWEDFVTVATALTQTDKGIYGFAANLDGQSGHDNVIFQNGGFVVSDDKKTSGVDKAEAIEAVQWYVDLIHKYKVSPTIEELVEVTPYEMFLSGKVAMTIQGSWMLSAMLGSDYVVDNGDVTYLFHGKKKAVIANGLGNVISKNTPNEEASWKFLKFLSGEEGNLIQAREGSAIPAFKSAQKEWANSNDTFNIGVFTDQLSYGVPYPNSKTRNIWYQDERRILSRVWSGEVSVKEGLTTYADKMNELLKTE